MISAGMMVRRNQSFMFKGLYDRYSSSCLMDVNSKIPFLPRFKSASSRKYHRQPFESLSFLKISSSCIKVSTSVGERITFPPLSIMQLRLFPLKLLAAIISCIFSLFLMPTTTSLISLSIVPARYRWSPVRQGNLPPPYLQRLPLQQEYCWAIQFLFI